MFQFINTFNVRRRTSWLWRLFLLAALVGRPLPAHAVTTNLTSASFSSLQTALESPGTITLSFDDTIVASNILEIAFDTVLDASGHTITLSGNGSAPVFYVDPGVNFKIINLTISGGISTGAIGSAGPAGSSGGSTGGNGGVGQDGQDGLGGALYNDGNTTLVDCILVGNQAKGGDGGAGGAAGNGSFQPGNGGNGGNGGQGFGAAIYNSSLGFLVLTNCTLAGNTATGGNGGAGGANVAATLSVPGKGGLGGVGAGSGLYNLGSVIVINCTFNQNSVQGGNTQTAGGPIQGNGDGPDGAAGAAGQGGAIANSGTNTIVNCTFFKNVATGGNGGNGGTTANAFGNGGKGGNGGNGFGGSLFNSLSGFVGATNCTFATNSVAGGTGGVGGAGQVHSGANGNNGLDDGANIANAGGTFNFKNSILSGSTNTTTNAFGAISDQGNNISSDATPAFSSGTSSNRLDSKLAIPGLIDNGGPTLTIGLRSGSPAIDKADDAASPAFDQRGFPRPFGPHSDIGAFEFGASNTLFSIKGQVRMGPNPLAGVTVTAGNGSGISDTSGGFQILLSGGANYTVAPQPQAYFNPSSASVSLTNNVSNLVFTATNFIATFTNNSTTNTNSFQLSFSGIPNFTFRIQASTNLTSWVDIATNTFGTNGVSTFTFFNTNTFFSTNVATNLPQIFFRTAIP